MLIQNYKFDTSMNKYKYNTFGVFLEFYGMQCVCCSARLYATNGYQRSSHLRFFENQFIRRESHDVPLLVMEDDLTAAAGCDEFVLSTRVGVEEGAVCVITLVGQFVRSETAARVMQKLVTAVAEDRGVAERAVVRPAF